MEDRVTTAKQQHRPLLGQILEKIAPRIGAQVNLEPDWKIVGQIRFKSGRIRYFRYSSLDINPLGASEIAKDKDYSAYFMKELGYSTVPGMTFFSPEWSKRIGVEDRDFEAAYRYARSLTWPVIVKPNSGSQGRNVCLVHTKRGLQRALREIFKQDRIALVQKPVIGKDYRIIVLDNQIISAYERLPLSVVGDGKHTLRELLGQKQEMFVASSRDTAINIDDPRIRDKLLRRKLTLDHVPNKGELVQLLDNNNLSTGGDSQDVTDHIHPSVAELAVQLTREMGLRLCGVDIMIDGGIHEQLDRYWIIEINAAPGLDHYVKAGETQQRIVEDLYLRVLKSMDV